MPRWVPLPTPTQGTAQRVWSLTRACCVTCAVIDAPTGGCARSTDFGYPNGNFRWIFYRDLGTPMQSATASTPSSSGDLAAFSGTFVYDTTCCTSCSVRMVPPRGRAAKRASTTVAISLSDFPWSFWPAAATYRRAASVHPMNLDSVGSCAAKATDGASRSNSRGLETRMVQCLTENGTGEYKWQHRSMGRKQENLKTL